MDAHGDWLNPHGPDKVSAKQCKLGVEISNKKESEGDNKKDVGWLVAAAVIKLELLKLTK